MKQLSTVIEVPLLPFNFSNYQSYKVKGDLLSAASKRKTNLTTFMSETKVHLQENQGFPFFLFFSEKKQIAFLVGSS